MVETEHAQWKIAKIDEKQRRTAKRSLVMHIGKSMSLNPFPVTDLRPEVELMHLLRMRRQYCHVWNSRHWTDKLWVRLINIILYKVILFICTHCLHKQVMLFLRFVCSSVRRITQIKCYGCIFVKYLEDALALDSKIFTQRGSVAKNVGCFQRHLFVCLFGNTITSERVNIGWWNLEVGALYKNFGRVRIWGS